MNRPGAKLIAIALLALVVIATGRARAQTGQPLLTHPASAAWSAGGPPSAA